MSWNIRYYHTLLYLKGIPNQESLDDVLAASAERSLRDLRSSFSLRKELEDLGLDYDLDDLELTHSIDSSVRSFIRDVQFEQSHTSVLIESEYDSENSCDEFVDYLARMLFSYSCKSYILLNRVALDKRGAYGHQYVLHLHDGKFIKTSIVDFVDPIFAQPSSRLLPILSAIQEV